MSPGKTSSLLAYPNQTWEGGRMAHSISVRPLSGWDEARNILMLPLMYVLIGSSNEYPQCTHPWTWERLEKEDVEDIAPEKVVNVRGMHKPTWFRKFLWDFLPWFRGGLKHITIFGGPRDYVVIEPRIDHGEEMLWYVGWDCGKAGPVGVSRIPLRGKVRLLVLSDDVRFFGIHAVSGEVIKVEQCGRGRIGENTEFAHIPLL